MSTSRRAFLSGHWISGQGDVFRSIDPATGAVVWEGRAATEHDVKSAIATARAALPAWAGASVENRIAMLNRFAEELRQRKPEMAEAICRETGKPRWEALLEVDAMAAKVAISIEAFHDRRRPAERQQAGAIAATRYKPMGVMAVFGPFNMPGHLPNGHIVPALLAGNTIVFKPSELTPGVGEKLAEMFHHAGIPAGVVNLLQGGRDVGAMLAQHPGVDGVLFTGSVAGGLAISRATVEQPWKILALEMGGNNPLVVWEANDLDAAAYLTIQSAFITAGQRCSCARRLIVPDDSLGRALIDRLIAMMKTIRVGPHTQRPEPFMGPVISDAAAERLFASQAEMISAGATPLLALGSPGEMPGRTEHRFTPGTSDSEGPDPSRPDGIRALAGARSRREPSETATEPRCSLSTRDGINPIAARRAMLSPALIDVTAMADRPDTEFFGPLLQVIRVSDFDAAIAEANKTSFGLAAGLFSDNADLWNRFYKEIRAGVVYWNRQTTGGSSHLPFGGIGSSGNFRPSGYWAADYCSYPVASMENASLTMPAQTTPGIG